MRAVGIIRQSNSRGKSEGLSPAEQREKIEAYCAGRRWDLVDVHEEIDVSGGRALDRRPGLGAAVRAVEAGQADVVVASEFTRLFRSIRVQEDVIERVRAAGGEVVAIDLGSLGGETSSQWMTTGFLGVLVATVEALTRLTCEEAGVGFNANPQSRAAVVGEGHIWVSPRRLDGAPPDSSTRTRSERSRSTGASPAAGARCRTRSTSASWSVRSSARSVTSSASTFATTCSWTGSSSGRLDAPTCAGRSTCSR